MVVGLAGVVVASGAPLELPRSLPQAVTSETRATATPPFPLRTEDFELTWVREPVDGVRVTVVPGSLEWVRAAEVLVIPRARIRLEADAGTTGWLRVEGQHTPLGPDGSAEAVVALLSSVPIEVHVGDQAGVMQAMYRGPFRSARDVSCSRWRADIEGGPDDSWAYVGCRRTVVGDTRGRSTSLELAVTWDQAPDVPLEPVLNDTWLLRGTPGAEAVALGQAGDGLTIRYRIPERHHDLTIGVVMGGSFQPNSGRGTAPLGYTRVWADLAISDSTGFLIYDYANLHPDFFANDVGGYWRARISRPLDGRLEVSTLLGAHVQTFIDDGETFTEMGFPQGLDLTFLDLPAPSWMISAGGFVGLPLGGEWFANTYLRVGPGPFLELAFTGWAKQVPIDDTVDQRLFTIGLGGPLLRAL